MAKYRHQYRGASAADVMLAVDSAKENYEEIKAYEAYLAELRRQNKKKRRGGILGSVLGAVVGFFTGGVGAAIFGSTLGGAAATVPMSMDYYDKNKRELNKKIWKGGKFNHQQMKDTQKALKDQVESQKDADVMSLAIDAVTAGIGISKAGGFLKGAEKAAWKGMSAGEKIGTFFGGDKLVEDKLKSQAEQSLMSGDNKSVLDLIQSRNKMLNPENIFGGTWRPFKAGFGKTVMDVAGQLKDPISPSGQLARFMTQREGIKRGDVDLAQLMMQNSTWDRLGQYKKR